MYHKVTIRKTNAWVVFWFVSILYAFWFLARDLFIAQWSRGPFVIAAVTALLVVRNIFLEWALHKYVLHGTLPVPLRDHWPVRSFYEAHDGRHHFLTRLSQYAILDESQIQSSTFPCWALPVLILIDLPFLSLAQYFLASTVPVILSGIFAESFSYYTYETLHALYHADFESVWKPLVEIPGHRGRFYKWVYEYHKGHHRNSRTNLNMVIPLADLLLGTLRTKKA
ncbi:hypothetical protein A3H65_00960 [Candidatus Giovannonibacteria bacterium RIFCSPLOWO2_02_FULL_45_14]|uniref:Fatty acid hydroxylase domain-containing protein n=1 Tax=Candidatus Giovannonibacteria bacterium RIFCSPLOWO2_12_FULL_44_15 TaxID=1798364 RepID=A0A1F5Y0Q3_9BACT|nr:MAG: hypothetical protein A3C75_01385 [Candidatus Giovannonibacteria bacterium RIFCSPHIGHO2_02_FULL_44_31]OGF76015.1 MAG: hypothetical protein A3E62_01795 [Candidatus Giovannonibacteria bacterium RIFCSPHIGHO2_12_FULL_44_29]OGF90911.1 MAG: hypothetical protein A3H65_00960 [Candidatus Giovannonibacteria bacterium RIFCSPLOWO2_02_FULL_45_14]OGF93431.1 MAG: hypothetical protein A3G54_04030 [Candidatus Giovannonibacteria bacterium RIFCSPLOWO2_12_FULL_44_15]